MIHFSVRGIDEWRRKFAELSKAHKKIVDKAAAEYIAGIEDGTEGGATHGAAHYPAYQWISRAQAYPDAPAGAGWFSDKQRRYVMAKIASGEIDPGAPKRTGALQRGWYVQDQGSFYTVKNESAYAPYLHGNTMQARQPALVGWRRIADIISTNINGAVRHAKAKLREWMKENGM